ncbi:MAG: glycosyltransferase family 39 protein [Bryobacterales bacterium]|nr:glycosyltransferase family 39 protein [Bryobacterales bacterium]
MRPWPPELAVRVAWFAIAAGFLVRAYLSATNFLNADEVLHLLKIEGPGWAGAMQVAGHGHPPFHLLAVNATLTLFGRSEFSLRLPSLLAGGILIWLAYRWMSAVAGRTAGAVAAIVFAALHAAIVLAAEVRDYSIALCFAAASLFAFERAVRQDRRYWLVLSGVFAGLMLFTEFVMAIFAVALGLYALARLASLGFPRRIAGFWAAGQALAGVTGVAIYFAYLYRTGAGGGVGRGMRGGYLRHWFLQPGGSFPDFAWRNTVEFFSYSFGSHPAGWIALALFAAGCWLAWQRDRPLLVLLLAPFVLGIGAASAGVLPYGGSRHTAYGILSAAAGVCLPLAGIARWRPKPFLAGAAALGSLLYATASYDSWFIPRPNQRVSMIRDAIAYLRESVPPEGVVFVTGQGWQTLGYYLGPDPNLTIAEMAGLPVTYRSNLAVASLFNWSPSPSTFLSAYGEWRRKMPKDTQVWVFDAGWDTNLATGIRRDYPQLNLVGLRMFGTHVSVFRAPNVSVQAQPPAGR